MKLIVSCAALAGSLILPSAAAAQGKPECRDVTVSEGGKPKRTTMCKGADGQWRPVTATGAASAAGGPLPANFRGQITYRGSYEAVAHQPIRVPRRLTVRNVTSALGGGPREQGTVTYVIEYDGNLVTGTYTGANSRGRNSGRFSGTRQGNQCRLFDERTQAPYVATCDAGIFRGEARSEPSARVSSRTEFDAAATETVDYVVRDRQRAEDARTRAEQERQRQAEAARAAERERQRIAAMPLAGTAATQKLDTAVRIDAGAWILNRYNPGSMRNVRVASGTATNGVLRGEYTYNGGSSGTVEAQVQGGTITCLNYWDVGSCVAIRRGSRGDSSESRSTAGDYQALQRCYAFHKFKIEFGTSAKDSEIISSGREQLEIDLSAIYIYASRHGIARGTALATADRAAASRRVRYLDRSDAAKGLFFADQDYCSSDPFLQIVMTYQ